MGDMADLTLDSWMDDELFWENVMYDEETDSYIGPGCRRFITCKRCGERNLRWGRIVDRWILYNNDQPHRCPKRPLPLEVLKEQVKQNIKKGCKIMSDENILTIPSWDETFMHDVYWWARRSKDPRTKIGAVLVHWDSKDPISHAYNGFARTINDNVPSRWERPEKYFWVSHGESNAILNCSRTGRSTKGTIMFTQGVPCADCANDIIQAGIVEIVVHKQWQQYEEKFNLEKWEESTVRSKIKLEESGIRTRIFDGVLNIQGMLDGKIINV